MFTEFKIATFADILTNYKHLKRDKDNYFLLQKLNRYKTGMGVA